MKLIFLDKIIFYTNTCKNDFCIMIRFEKGTIFNEKSLFFNCNRYKHKMLRKNINNRIRYILYYFIIDTRNKFDDEIFKSLFINYTQ